MSCKREPRRRFVLRGEEKEIARQWAEDPTWLLREEYELDEDYMA